MNLESVTTQAGPLPLMLDVQLVGIEESVDALLLDGVVVATESPTLGPVGSPLTFRVSRRRVRAQDAVACELLTNWAATGTTVRFVIGGAPQRRWVAITDGEEVVHLAVEVLDERSPAALEYDER